MGRSIGEQVSQNFVYDGKIISAVPFGNGHINDTFLLTLDNGHKAILQKINKSVFQHPEEVMENILNVTSYLREMILKNGGDSERETLTVILSVSGEPYYVDEDGEYWRSYEFISDATCLERLENRSQFFEIAVGFGKFQKMLSAYPAETLHETIEGFHDTRARFEVFKKAVADDVCTRAASVREEIEFVLAREEVADIFGNLLAKGEIPLRVTHNDTKINNIMLDDETGKAVCVLDLDTVMPGVAMNDFGDSIRSGAATAVEDERDLCKVSCDMELFDIYAKGFIEGCAGSLTKREIELLPMGAKVMTFECGMRFLTDYLQGDIYFRTHREGHNLDRARTQFRLVEDMEQKWEAMQEIIKKYSNQ